MKTEVAGIKFAVAKEPNLCLSRPSGQVVLKHEPFVHEKVPSLSDPDAIRVYWTGCPIGYLPQRGEVRKLVHEYLCEEGEMPLAEIVNYAYSKGKDDFNDNHEGILASVHIDVKVGVEQEEDSNFTHYHKDGKAYDRATNTLETIKFPGRLAKWMFDTFSSYDDYEAFMKEARGKGTEKHSGIEYACKAGAIGASDEILETIIRRTPKDIFDTIPRGFWNFVKNETKGMMTVCTEHPVYNDEYMVAGTYDINVHVIVEGKTIIMDWKSSSQVYPEHIAKTCFYAKEAGADEAWVVIFGVDTQKGYRIKKITDKKTIAAGHEILVTGKRLKELFKICGI